MANRKLPFGYCMESGQIRIAEEEANIVQTIFSRYAAGASYETLTASLNGGTVPYTPGKPWNKNAVARVLQDRRYLGDNIYPAIITEAALESVTPRTDGKRTHPRIKDIRILARCPACGGAVRRERKDAWRCSNCMTASAKTNDKRLIADVIGLLQWLYSNPNTVAVPMITSKDTISTAEDNATAMSIAADQLNALDSTDYEAMRIQYILSHSKLDDTLLRQITSAILIYPDGTVQLQLKNNQIIKKESDCI